MLHVEHNQTREGLSLITIRSFIDHVFDESPDFVNGLHGIEIIERNCNRPPNEECYSYVFQQEDALNAAIKLSKVGIRTSHTPGAIAYYINSKGNLCHVGIATNDGCIISKWEFDGHVYKHPPHHTLSRYGDIGAYFINPKK